MVFFFFKQKTAYEMRISDWSSDVCSSDLSEESDALEFGRPEADVTTRVDVSGFVDQKRRSMDCHRTQRQDLGWLLERSDERRVGKSVSVRVDLVGRRIIEKKETQP